MTTWQLFEESVTLSKLRLEYFEEGLCAQVMHIGPYATEPATIERMREFMKENRYRDCVGLGSKHHEIYLSDPRKADYFTSYPLFSEGLHNFIRRFPVKGNMRSIIVIEIFPFVVKILPQSVLKGMTYYNH